MLFTSLTRFHVPSVIAAYTIQLFEYNNVIVCPLLKCLQSLVVCTSSACIQIDMNLEIRLHSLEASALLVKLCINKVLLNNICVLILNKYTLYPSEYH